MAQSSSKKKNHNAPSESQEKKLNAARGITKRVSALGQHMERAKRKQKKRER